ncbi:MAG: hypothetical protein ISS47_05500 [Candidatus Omnitrophica bacterium]|nr:hypothetical protein [Candidatus Omnitrophota bacterium]
MKFSNNLISFFGIFIILFVAWLFSNNRRNIKCSCSNCHF